MIRARQLEVETIRDPARFASLRGEWRELLEDSASDGLFLTWEWTHCWWLHLAESRELRLFAVRAGSRLVGLAPFAKRRAALSGSPPLGCLELLGSGVVGSDHLDVIARRGFEAEVSRALAGSLGDAGAALALTRLRGDSLAQELGRSLSRLGWRAQETSLEICPFVQRPAGGFAAYLASLGPAHRYAFRRKLQALRKRFDVRFEQAATEEERRRSLRILIELHEERWRGRGTSEAFTTPALRAFHQALSARALERGWLRLFVLRLDGEPAAALYGFRYGRIFSFYQSGFAAGWAKESVGLVTMGLAIERAFAEGAAEFDLLHGDEPYKLHWAREVHRLTRLALYPPGARGFASEQAARLAAGARRLARCVISAVSSSAT